jgi:hypothetical protein
MSMILYDLAGADPDLRSATFAGAPGSPTGQLLPDQNLFRRLMRVTARAPAGRRAITVDVAPTARAILQAGARVRRNEMGRV